MSRENFRKAATLILTTPLKHRIYPCDYGVVMLKRSAKLRFMASTYVFPGGAISMSDQDPQWLDYIPQSENMKLTPSLSTAVPRPKLYKTDAEESVSRDLSLRISSIRECFEESGILLVEKDGQLIQAKDLPSQSEITKWRKTVEGSADEFLALCKEIKARPLVENLFEWSNWLTPPSILPYRFDTAFYLASIPFMPDYATEDGGETVDLQVMNPFEALARQERREHILHPPQFVEISRLARFQKMNDLLEYAEKRQVLGINCWCPVQRWTDTARLSLMESDEHHPDELKVFGNVEGTTEDSEEELAAQASRLARTVWTFTQSEEKGFKMGPMFTRSNQEFFSDQTLVNSAMDRTELLARIEAAENGCFMDAEEYSENILRKLRNL